jgi:hypothetical protein
LIAAYLEHNETTLVVNGDAQRLVPNIRGGQDEAARSFVALHAALRAHDSGPVHDPELLLPRVREVALQWLAQGEAELMREIAHKLNAEVIPTRKRSGIWHDGSASALLRGDI